MSIEVKKNSQIFPDSNNTYYPEDELQVSSLVKELYKKNIPTELIGTGSKSFIGNKVQSANKLSLSKLSGVIEYLPEELYSTRREAIEDEIFGYLKEKIEKNYINLDAILIRDVTLPLTLQTAIEQKLKQEQESLEYEFKIDKARKEAERKEIEAKGIFEFQRIVNRSITPQLLKWKGIEATQEIAKSPNAKVIVIGNGDGDLPIILGGE